MKNFKKYFFYAIGEIFLIVVGVLIAVNVNNSNSERKKEKELHSIIQQVNVNLENDIENLDTIIMDYESLDTLITDIIKGEYPINYIDTIDVSNYNDCDPCFGYHFGFSAFHPKMEGYENLKSLNVDFNTSKNEVIQEILSFYQDQQLYMKLMEQALKEEIVNNVRSIEQYEWYIDYMQGTYNPESVRYFHTNKMYKNKLATFRLLAIGNYLDMIKAYRGEAIILSEKLKEL